MDVARPLTVAASTRLQLGQTGVDESWRKRSFGTDSGLVADEQAAGIVEAVKTNGFCR